MCVSPLRISLGCKALPSFFRLLLEVPESVPFEPKIMLSDQLSDFGDLLISRCF